MAQKIQDSDFSRREIPLTPFHTFEEVSDTNTKTISHLLGWSDAEKKWFKVRVDSTGRLMTSVPGLATSHTINKISASDTESSVTLPENYTSHVIYNDGPNAAYLEFDGTATTNSFKLPAAASLGIDLEFKKLSVICASGETATVYWLALK